MQYCLMCFILICITILNQNVFAYHKKVTFVNQFFYFDLNVIKYYCPLQNVSDFHLSFTETSLSFIEFLFLSHHILSLVSFSSEKPCEP
jgi:hypothetical protein